MADRVLGMLEGICFVAAILVVAVTVALAIGGATADELLGVLFGALWGGAGLALRRYRMQVRMRKSEL